MSTYTAVVQTRNNADTQMHSVATQVALTQAERRKDDSRMAGRTEQERQPIKARRQIGRKSSRLLGCHWQQLTPDLMRHLCCDYREPGRSLSKVRPGLAHCVRHVYHGYEGHRWHPHGTIGACPIRPVSAAPMHTVTCVKSQVWSVVFSHRSVKA